MLTVAEVAKMVGWSTANLYARIKKGTFAKPTVQPGKGNKFGTWSEEDVQKWMDANPTTDGGVRRNYSKKAKSKAVKASKKGKIPVKTKEAVKSFLEANGINPGFLDVYHYHEVLHLTAAMQRMFELEIGQHPVVMEHRELRSIAFATSILMAELYQAIGGREEWNDKE